MTLKEELQKRVDEGLIRVQTNGNGLFIYNYTEECQFDKKWDEYTLMARGLILDADGNIIARPLKKFFNLDESPTPFTDPIPLEQVIAEHGTPIIQDKVDGSLGILYYHGGLWNLATRGSFNSDQAIEGMRILQEYYIAGIDWSGDEPDKTATHLFEIIYPENRIVLDYGDDEKLIYLTSIDIRTGDEFYDQKLTSIFEMPEIYTELKENVPNKEGYVLVFPDGFRVKIKHEEYKRLHRLMTGLSDKRIFECVSTNTEIDLTGVPEEFRDEVEEKINNYKEMFNSVKERIEYAYKTTDVKKIRRDVAMEWRDKYPDIQGLLFSRLDGKLTDDKIWKLIEKGI